MIWLVTCRPATSFISAVHIASLQTISNAFHRPNQRFLFYTHSIEKYGRLSLSFRAMPHHGNPVYFKETSPFDWGVKGYVKFQLVHGERTPRQIQDGWPRSLRVIIKCKNSCCSQDEIDQANVHYGRWKTKVGATLTPSRCA